MTRRQWAHLPLVALIAVSIPAGFVLALTARVFGYYLRLIARDVYMPSRRWRRVEYELECDGRCMFVPHRCTIPPHDHGDTCNGWPCKMVAEKLRLAGEEVPGPPYDD